MIFSFFIGDFISKPEVEVEFNGNYAIVTGIVDKVGFRPVMMVAGITTQTRLRLYLDMYFSSVVVMSVR